MFLKAKIVNESGKLLGKISFVIDWKNMKWGIHKDKQNIWPRISPSARGKIRQIDGRHLHLFDEMNKLRIIFQDGPASELDIFNPTGSARISSSIDSALTDTVMPWSIDFAAAAAESRSKGNKMNALRKRLLDHLGTVLPCSFGDKNYNTITGSLPKQADPNYTTCGSLPGYVAAKLWEYKYGRKADNNTLVRIGLNGTNIIRIRGKKFGVWIPADLIERPSPGDIYGLLDCHKTDRDVDILGHVGVIEDASGDIWKTHDLGQGDGYSGVKSMPREYNPTTGELYGAIRRCKWRVLAGWVDIDLFYAKI
jgi:hypothetical protein